MDIESILTIHNLKMSPKDIIKALAKITRSDLYRITLRVQDDLHFAENARYLSANPKWTAAKNVLDLGCGPGDLVARLSRCFADKFYVGIDLKKSFIKAAREQTQALKNCTFYRANLYKFAQGRYDFVIMRAVLQHLKKPDRFMRHLPVLLQDGAAVIFFETTKENFVVADPPIPTFNEFYG